LTPAHGILAGSHAITNCIGAIVAMHDVSGWRVGSSRNCVTIGVIMDSGERRGFA
jgi:hypothetical protein